MQQTHASAPVWPSRGGSGIVLGTGQLPGTPDVPGVAHLAVSDSVWALIVIPAVKVALDQSPTKSQEDQ